MLEKNQDLPKGTLELMILKVLSLEPTHGWGIIKRIQQLSQEVFQVRITIGRPASGRAGKTRSASMS